MKKLITYLSMTLLLVSMVVLPSACSLPWFSDDDDEYNITSKFIATWNVHEKLETHGDGSITYKSVSYGGLSGLVKENNLPVDWSAYESLTFEFAEPTKVETQVLLGNTMRTWGKAGITKLTCYFDGLDVRQIDQVVLQTAEPTVLTVKRVELSPVTTAWKATPIWEGECHFGNWETGFVLNPEMFASAKDGDKLEFVFTTDVSDPKRSYWQIKMVYNATDQTLEGNKSEQNQWGCTMVGQRAKSYRVRLTAKDVREAKKDGLFCNGYYVNVTQVNLLKKEDGSQPVEEEPQKKDENTITYY